MLEKRGLAVALALAHAHETPVANPRRFDCRHSGRALFKQLVAKSMATEGAGADAGAVVFTAKRLWL